MANHITGSKVLKSWWVKVILVILFLYFLLWVLYGLQYRHARQAVLHHYGGIGYLCSAGPLAPLGSLDVYKTADDKLIFLRPIFINRYFDYSISTKQGGYAYGYIDSLGIVHEISPGDNCLLQ